ncbi:MAG: Rdx family protein [Acidimicrobiia bacterium]
MTNIEIESGGPCRHLDRAIQAQRALERFGRRLEGLHLKTGHGGVFTIRVDDQQIFNTQRFDLEAIAAVVDQLAD